MSRASMRCPHCRHRGTVRSSVEVTELHRDLWYQCSNIACGHTWRAQLSFVHTISQPANPRPGLSLPVGDQKHRKPDRRNGDPPEPVAVTG